MSNLSHNVTAAIASVLIVATTLYQVITIPPVQATSAMVMPAIA